MPLWQIDIYPADGQIDREAIRTRKKSPNWDSARMSRSRLPRAFWCKAILHATRRFVWPTRCLCDSVTERSVVAIAGQDILIEPPGEQTTLVNVLPKPGVMDPVAASTVGAA